MIDFKYHLVSLVSVFMALAIGIVLGAGPLQDQIGITLNNQVEALRADKEQLNAGLVQARSDVEYRDQVLESLAPTIVENRLNGRRVVMLRLPNSSEDAATHVAQDLQYAGATLSGQLALSQSWVDPAAAEARANAAAAIAGVVGGQAPPLGETGDYLDRHLADAVLVSSGEQSATESAHGARVLDILRDAGLIAVEGVPQQRATMVAAISGTRATDAKDDEGAGEADQRLLHLLTTLRSRGMAVVLAAPQSTDDSTSLLAALRSDEDARASISGVGGIEDAAGPIVAVLALVEQAAGGAGQYGSGPNAQEPLPQLPAPEPASTP